MRQDDLNKVPVVEYQVKLGEPITLHTQESTMKAPEGVPQKHCIILHGWGDNSSSMFGIRDTLRALPEAAGWRFWWVDPGYETHWKSFKDSAQEVYEKFLEQPYDFCNTVFVAYSEGGQVARQMVARGFPCHALVTVCSPHHGLGDWILTPDFGSGSVSPGSDDLKALNNNPREAVFRERYYLFAIVFKDGNGQHNDDGVVTAPSALGQNLGQVALRQRIQLNYPWGIAGIDPHLRGKSKDYWGSVFETCKQIFRQI